MIDTKIKTIDFWKYEYGIRKDDGYFKNSKMLKSNFQMICNIFFY